MSVIYSYPIKSTPVSDDLILISDSASSPQFATKQVKVSTLPFSNNAGTVTSVGVAVPAAFEASAAITTSGTITIGVTGGNVGQYLAYDGTWGTPAGGAANPAGAVTQVQYHDTGSAFGASPNFTFGSDILNVQDTIIIKGDGSSVAGSLRLNCYNNSHNVTIVGPAHTSAVSYSITLPNTITTQSAVSGGRVLEVDASGVGNWITTPTGGGSSYDAGNGIDINTGASPNIINTSLYTNGGLIFNTTHTPNRMQVNLAATDMSGELRAVDGGTGLSTYGVGDLLYAETTTTLGALNISSNDKILGINNAGTLPEWITNLVGKEVSTGHMLIGAGTSAMTAIDTTTKGTIAMGNGSTTTTLAVGTQDYVLTSRTAAATGADWVQMGTSKMSDYEVGSWTPAPYTATGSAPSTGTCLGYYERIGDIVVVHFYLPITSSSASNVPMMIGGLPYTSATGNGYLGGVSLYANNGTTYIQQQAVSGMVNGAYINLYRFTSTTDYDYTAASWYAAAALSYTIAGTATYRKA